MRNILYFESGYIHLFSRATIAALDSSANAFPGVTKCLHRYAGNPKKHYEILLK